MEGNLRDAVKDLIRRLNEAKREKRTCGMQNRWESERDGQIFGLTILGLVYKPKIGTVFFDSH